MIPDQFWIMVGQAIGVFTVMGALWIASKIAHNMITAYKKNIKIYIDNTYQNCTVQPPEDFR